MQDWLNGFYELNPDAVEEVEEVKKKTYKLDMFKTVLPAIYNKDLKFYSRLSKEEKDSLSPWILMRWLSSSTSDSKMIRDIRILNKAVNDNFSCLSERKTSGKEGHKELQWMLLCLCSSGHDQKKFISAPAGVKKNKLEEAILSIYPLLKDDELEMLLKINSKHDIEEFFKDNGYDDNTIKELLKFKV